MKFDILFKAANGDGYFYRVEAADTLKASAEALQQASVALGVLFAKALTLKSCVAITEEAASYE